MSVGITVEHARKDYGANTIIPDLSLKIREGEFFTLLGPSGCGKTTLLRMIAGFNSIEGGKFYFNQRCINDLDPAKRKIGMVFQNYAIFPHMSVRKNIEFGLKNQKLSRNEIDTRTNQIMKLVKIEEYAERMPDRLSGGQQQRVALARAIVIQPDVLLMDEPLSNLDAKLRVEMRTTIKDIQRRVGITTVYVTHDQEEAMAVSDRIAVMNQGVVQHIGTPKDIYLRPANRFVATFIGRSNLVEGRLEISGERVFLVFKNGYRVEMDNICPKYRKPQDVLVSIRPEELLVASDPEGEGITATVDDRVFLGLNTHYFVTLETGEKAEIIQESMIGTDIDAGKTVRLTVNRAKINLFTTDGTVNILEGVQNQVWEQ